MKLSLYRKYRPQTFAQVVAHAYIFAGPRGIGKTSMAKILAKALNCTGADGSITAPTVTPCGVCESCRSIAAGTALDVVEMDAASNRGIDDMRELRDKIAFVPVQGRSKVYIIDEAHMLTKEAFNALLKTLEEPPANVVFVLATTEPHKIIATILSRCQRFDFRRPLTRDIMKVLRQIIAAENEAAAAGDPDAQTIAIDDDALAVIAEYADGGFRDAIGTLDKLATQFSGSISRKDLDKVLGTINSELLFEITDIIIERDSAGALLFVQQLADQSKNYQQFIVNLLRHLRQLFVVQHVGALHELQDEQRTRLERALEQSTHLVTERLEQITAQANQLDERQLIYVIETLGRAQGEIKSGLDARLQLELALVKATRPQLDHSVAALEERLRRLETAQLPLGATSLSMPAAPVPVAATQAPAAAAGEPAKPAAAATAAAATASAPATAASSVAGDALAPTQSAASELSLTRVESAWALVLQRLQATDAPLAAALATARPAQLADGHLTVAVGSSFALTAASGPGNGALVADAVEHILGQRPTIAFTLASRHRPTTDTAAGTAKSGPAGHTNAEPSDSQVMPAGPATDEAAPTPPASSIPSDAPAQASLSFAEKIRLVEKELDAKILSDEQ
jgi:DNA polymerase-3 subunit gamma/tau